MVEREKDLAVGAIGCSTGGTEGSPTVGRRKKNPARGMPVGMLDCTPGLCMLKLEPAHGRELSAFETCIFHHGWQASQMEEALSSPDTHWGIGFFLKREDSPGHGEGHGENPRDVCREDGHGKVGRLCAYIFMDSALDECEVANIAVHEDLRGLGLGGRLLDRALQEARDRHIRTCFLEVASGNLVARSLYVSRGFIEVGQRKGYYSETGDDAIVMRLEL